MQAPSNCTEFNKCSPLASNPLLERWRSAEDAAQAAERAVFNAAMAFMEGSGPAPCQVQWEHSKELRRAANDLFQLALLNMSSPSAPTADDPNAAVARRPHD